MNARFRRTAVPLLLLAAGFAVGRAAGTSPTALADTRTSPARESFQTGGARSEAVLKEIAATLETIDGRLARIEAAIPRK